MTWVVRSEIRRIFVCYDSALIELVINICPGKVDRSDTDLFSVIGSVYKLSIMATRYTPS